MSESIQSISSNPVSSTVSSNTATPGVVNPPNPTPAPMLGLAIVLAVGIWGWRAFHQRNRDAEAASEQPRFSQPLHWISAGKQQEKAGQFAAAIALYEAALEFYPNDFRLWHERGLALAKVQQFEAAIASYNRAYALRPRQRDLAHERGDALLQLGRYEEAIASFDLFLQFVPDNSHVLTDRGFALLQLERYEESLHSLRRALKSAQLDPQSKQLARYYQIQALRQLGQLDEALKLAQQALTDHPTDQFRQLYDTLRQQRRSNNGCKLSSASNADAE